MAVTNGWCMRASVTRMSMDATMCACVRMCVLLKTVYEWFFLNEWISIALWTQTHFIHNNKDNGNGSEWMEFHFETALSTVYPFQLWAAFWMYFWLFVFESFIFAIWISARPRTLYEMEIIVCLKYQLVWNKVQRSLIHCPLITSQAKLKCFR